MSQKRLYADYLRDMLEYAMDAEQFVADMRYEQFEASRQTQHAVLYALTIIGEAATRIPSNVRDQHPSVPWRDIITMRNRLIHAYPGVDLGVVWDTIINDLPPLKAQVAAILAEMEDTP